MKRIRVFVDHANFEIAWREEIGEDGPHIAWEQLPKLIFDQLANKGFIEKQHADLRGITVYASTHPEPDEHDAKYEQWLKFKLDQLPSYTVKTSVRQRQLCNHGHNAVHFVEKGVDTKIACDMLSLAMRDLYDLGVIISDDSDLVPSVECVQDILDRQIVHLGFRNSGQIIRSAAWGHLLLDNMKNQLRGKKRKPRPIPNTVMAAKMTAAQQNPS